MMSAVLVANDECCPSGKMFWTADVSWAFIELARREEETRLMVDAMLSTLLTLLPEATYPHSCTLSEFDS